MSTAVTVARLLQSPRGAPAPEAAAGDMVRVSDSSSTVYLSPTEYDQATNADLRYLPVKNGR